MFQSGHLESSFIAKEKQENKGKNLQNNAQPRGKYLPSSVI